MKNFVSYFEDMPRCSASNKVFFVSGTLTVDSPDTALGFLGIPAWDDDARAQMKQFQKKKDIAELVRFYNDYIEKVIRQNVKNGVLQHRDSKAILNKSNRVVDVAYIKNLANRMKKGKFGKVSPQGLIFYVKDRPGKSPQRMLLDGQNRLLACLVSRTFPLSFHAQLTDDSDVFRFLDLGKQRKASTAVSYDLQEQIGAAANLIQRNTPYLAAMVLKIDPQKAESAVQLALFSYLKSHYVNVGGTKSDMLTALYKGMSSDPDGIGFGLFRPAFLVNGTGSFSQAFIAGMLRALIEAVEENDIEAQRKVYAVIKQIGDMRRGDNSVRRAPELDRFMPYMERIFGMSNNSRGHRNIATMMFHSLFTSIVFNRKKCFVDMMSSLERYDDFLASREDFSKAMRSRLSAITDTQGKQIFLFKEIEQELSEEARRFERYRRKILDGVRDNTVLPLPVD